MNYCSEIREATPSFIDKEKLFLKHSALPWNIFWSQANYYREMGSPWLTLTLVPGWPQGSSYQLKRADSTCLPPSIWWSPVGSLRLSWWAYLHHRNWQTWYRVFFSLKSHLEDKHLAKRDKHYYPKVPFLKAECQNKTGFFWLGRKIGRWTQNKNQYDLSRAAMLAHSLWKTQHWGSE